MAPMSSHLWGAWVRGTEVWFLQTSVYKLPMSTSFLFP